MKHWDLSKPIEQLPEKEYTCFIMVGERPLRFRTFKDARKALKTKYWKDIKVIEE